MISCVEWIPRGIAHPEPKRHVLSKKDDSYLEQRYGETTRTVDDPVDGRDDSNNNEEDKNYDEKESTSSCASNLITSTNVDASALPVDLRMHEYSDNEESSEGERAGELLIREENYEDTTRTEDAHDDYTLAQKDQEKEEHRQYEEEDESDAEDTTYKMDDALLIVAKLEEGYSSLVVHVYEENKGNLFVHHEIPLPSYPLCLAHGTIDKEGDPGNFVAVGTFDPGIEIWDLDILDVLEPMCVLGGVGHVGSSAKKTKNKRVSTAKGPRGGSHTDAIMALSWSTLHPQVLASGSADSTVKIWDVTRSNGDDGGPAATFTHHDDKVQSVAWHPTDSTILASGSFDRSLCIVDARIVDGSQCKKVKLFADCEAIAWDPHHPQYLSLATENGKVTCWDVRKFETANYLWSFVAHADGECKGISYNPSIPGLMATCSMDKTVALWDTQHFAEGNDPLSCGSKDMKVGNLYTVSFYPSSPWLLGCGGSGNELALWDLSGDSTFRDRFSDRVVRN